MRVHVRGVDDAERHVLATLAEGEKGEWRSFENRPIKPKTLNRLYREGLLEVKRKEKLARLTLRGDAVVTLL